MVSGAGGAFAHRRRDVSNLSELSYLFTVFCNPFVSFSHFPDHHRSPTLISSLVVGDLVTTLPRVSSILWSSKLVVADEIFLALGLARSYLSRSALSQNCGSYRAPVCRSMDPRYFACFVDQVPHRKAALEPVVMTAAEGLSRIHQVSFLTLYKCYVNALASTAPKHQPLVVYLLPLRNCSPSPPTCLGQTIIGQAIGKLGFLLMGLSIFGPLWFQAWPISRIGGPTPLPTRPRSFSISESFIYHVLPSRHKSKIGRGLPSRLESTSVHELSDYQSTDLKLQSSKLISVEVFSMALVWLYMGVRVIEEVSLSPRPSKALTGSSTGFIWFTLSKFSFKKSLQISSLWERSHPPSSLLRERSHPLSSILRERSFPPISLSMRGEFLSVSSASKPKNRTTLTVLLSCVAVCSGPEDTTSLILISLGGRGFISTSQVKVTMWLASGHAVNVMLGSVDEFGLKTASSTGVLVLVGLHISPDVISSFLKLGFLSLSFACFKFLVFMFAFGFCPIKPILYITN